MGHLMYGYRRNERGRIEYRRFDSDDFPVGWVDAPDKVAPGVEPPPPPYRVSREPPRAVDPGDRGGNTPMPPMKRGPGRPRKGA